MLQTPWLKEEKCLFSWFWEPEVWVQRSACWIPEASLLVIDGCLPLGPHKSFLLCVFVLLFLFCFLFWCVVYMFAHLCARVYMCMCLSMFTETECQPWVPSFPAPLYYRAFNLLFWLDWLVNELLTLARLHSAIPLLPKTGTTHICWRIRLFAWVLDIWTKQLMFAQQPFIHQLALLFL